MNAFNPRTLSCSATLALLALTPLAADTLQLTPAADGYIRASQSAAQTDNPNNSIFLVGDTASANDYLRGVLSFDLTNPALVGATINSVTLSLKINSLDSGASANQSETLELHALDASFTEGGVTWTSRNGVNTWTSPGGDFGGTLATAVANPTTVTIGQTLAFSGGGLTADAIGSIGGSYYLLVKLATENATRSIFRFGAAEGSSTYDPVLTIDFTVATVPEPSTYGLLGGLAALGFASARRRRVR